jgi:hypothetical protein
MFKRPLADPSHDLFEMLRQHPNADALYILYLCLRGPRESLEKTEFPTMSEAQDAAILFIEQWRAHGQALAERDTPYEMRIIQSWNLPKRPTYVKLWNTCSNNLEETPAMQTESALHGTAARCTPKSMEKTYWELSGNTFTTGCVPCSST